MRSNPNSISPLPLLKTPSFSAGLTKRLALALESARQIAFEWSLNDGHLYFSGEPSAGLKEVLRDTCRPWQARDFWLLVHPADRRILISQLRSALKGRSAHTFLCNLELRLKNGSE